MDFEKISKIYNISTYEVKSRYNSWLSNKKKKSKVIQADLNLLSTLSGLSTTSISNFLNGKEGSISKEKAAKLEKLIKLVDYFPSTAARKLRSIHKMSIAFISPITDSANPRFYTEILKGVKKEANKYGFYIDIYDVGDSEEEKFFERMPFMGVVDALIVVSLNIPEASLLKLTKRNIPVVLVHPCKNIEKAPITDAIIPDTEVFKKLLDHLFIDCQYKKPVLITLNPENHIIRKHKIDLFKTSLSENHIPINEESNIFFIKRHTFFEGKRAYKEVMSKNNDTDVFVCLSDIVAAAVYREIEKEKKKIAVTGYDNSDISYLFDLTTIDQKMEETGKIAFQKLYFAIRHLLVNKKFPEYQKTLIPLEFIRRSSSAVNR